MRRKGEREGYGGRDGRKGEREGARMEEARGGGGEGRGKERARDGRKKHSAMTKAAAEAAAEQQLRT